MKKFLLMVPAILGIGMIFGCNNTRVPEGGNYYQIGDVYRIIEVEGEAEHKSDLPIDGNVRAVPGLFNEVTVHQEEKYPANSLFFEFDEINLLTSTGAEIVYKYLNYDFDAQNLSQTYTKCAGTELCTFNQKVKLDEPEEIKVPVLGGYVGGYVADADIYTFKYTDISVKSGNKVSEGSFKAIIAHYLYPGSYYDVTM